MTLPLLYSTDAGDDPCVSCPHPWHGLPCRHPSELGGSSPCRCPGPWASEAPAE